MIRLLLGPTLGVTNGRLSFDSYVATFSSDSVIVSLSSKVKNLLFVAREDSIDDMDECESFMEGVMTGSRLHYS